MDINPLLTKAEELLTTNPRDDIHDLSHHLRVWDNAQKIAKSLPQKIDGDVLHVATIWHDVMITKESLALGEKGLSQETIQYLDSFMTKKGFHQTFRTAVVKAIKQHGFLTRYQMTTEGKILFDADKLDALDPKRYRRIMAGIKHKKLSKMQTFLMAQAARLWLKTMRTRYHFDASRAMHDRLISNLLKDSEAVHLAKEWGVDIANLVKQ